MVQLPILLKGLDTLMRREALITASTSQSVLHIVILKNLRGRPFDFCGEVWVILEKIYPED